MATFIRNIVHQDQQGFIPKNNISNSAISLQSLIDLLEERKEDAFFLSIDQEKAFDKLEHHFLLKALEAKGFFSQFIDKIKDIYQSTTAKVIINDKQTKSININTGVRQGDPLSS